MSTRSWWYAVHKWVGLIVGIQILAWMVSGLYMTYVPIEQVRSEHNVRKPPELDLRALHEVSVPDKAIKSISGQVTRLELGEMNGRAVWRVDVAGKPSVLIDPASGDVISPLGEAQARLIAEADFAGAGTIVRASLITNDAPIEYRGALPVWQIVFNDESNTHLYLSPLSGKVAARRSDVWRTYDFLWSLHIMDYRSREDFNHWLVIVAALGGFALTITGFALLAYRFLPKRLER